MDTNPPSVVEIPLSSEDVDTNATSRDELDDTSHADNTKTTPARSRGFQRRSTEPSSNVAKGKKEVKKDGNGDQPVADKWKGVKVPLPTLTFGVDMDRRHHDEKVVGMEEGLRRFMARATSITNRQSTHTLVEPGVKGHKRVDSGYSNRPRNRNTIEADEEYARRKAETRPFVIFIIGGIAATKVFLYYLITLDSLLACAMSVGLTLFWYFKYENGTSWLGRMDWVLLGFAVVTPISTAIGIAFRRRERALRDIAIIRSSIFQIYAAHCLWDWPDGGGRACCKDVDWLSHTDSVLRQLISIGDELCHFLTLPTWSRSRHRMTHSGRKEAARTVEVAYRLFDSLYTHRMMRLTMYGERLKGAGLPSGEISRVWQYQRFIGEAVEDLRMIKMYRTPQALRSFGRIFTTLLPPFYAPTFAQLARDVNSLAVGILFSLITAIGLTALFESIQQLEDPFVAFITLDGIDVREEFNVLNWQQLVEARQIIYPYALPFPEEVSISIAGSDSDANRPEKSFADKLESFESLTTRSGGEFGYASPTERTEHRRIPTETSTRTSAFFLDTSPLVGGSTSGSSKSIRLGVK